VIAAPRQLSVLLTAYTVPICIKVAAIAGLTPSDWRGACYANSTAAGVIDVINRRRGAGRGRRSLRNKPDHAMRRRLGCWQEKRGSPETERQTHRSCCNAAEVLVLICLLRVRHYGPQLPFSGNGRT
jgi:hypothetical protein